MVLRVLRDAHQAEEVSQEVFLEAWRTSARFDPDRGSARTWLMTLAHRRAVDRVRSSEAARRRDHVYADDRTHPPATPPDALTEAAADRALLDSALASLSALQRQAVELSYFGGFTHREVASRLGVPLGTAKWRIREGLHRLRLSLVATPEPAR